MSAEVLNWFLTLGAAERRQTLKAIRVLFRSGYAAGSPHPYADCAELLYTSRRAYRENYGLTARR